MPDSPVVAVAERGGETDPRRAARRRRRHARATRSSPGSRRCSPTPSTGPTTISSCRRARCTAARRAPSAPASCSTGRQGLALQLLHQRAHRRRDRRGLIEDQPAELPRRSARCRGRARIASGARGAARVRGGGKPASERPAVFVLPGILGSQPEGRRQAHLARLRLLNGLATPRPGIRRPPAGVEPDGPIGMSTTTSIGAPRRHPRGDPVRLRLAPADRGRGAPPRRRRRRGARRARRHAASRCAGRPFDGRAACRARCSSSGPRPGSA